MQRFINAIPDVLDMLAIFAALMAGLMLWTTLETAQTGLDLAAFSTYALAWTVIPFCIAGAVRRIIKG